MQRLYLIICFSLMSLCASAQIVIEALPRWLGSVHINYLIPQTPVDMFLQDDQVGYQIEFQYRVQYNKPFLAGGYFSESSLSKYILYYTQSSGNGDTNIKDKSNTRRLETGITAGFYPEINWLIQPYLQGRMGVAIFQTSSILTNDDTDESIERISEYTTAIPAYGLDFGLHIVPNIWYIRGDLRVGYVGNTSTSFLLLDEDDAGTTGIPIEYFDTYTSPGQWLKISAGLSILF